MGCTKLFLSLFLLTVLSQSIFADESELSGPAPSSVTDTQNIQEELVPSSGLEQNSTKSASDKETRTSFPGVTGGQNPSSVVDQAESNEFLSLKSYSRRSSYSYYGGYNSYGGYSYGGYGGSTFGYTAAAVGTGVVIGGMTYGYNYAPTYYNGNYQKAYDGGDPACRNLTCPYCCLNGTCQGEYTCNQYTSSSSSTGLTVFFIIVLICCCCCGCCYSCIKSSLTTAPSSNDLNHPLIDNHDNHHQDDYKKSVPPAQYDAHGNLVIVQQQQPPQYDVYGNLVAPVQPTIIYGSQNTSHLQQQQPVVTYDMNGQPIYSQGVPQVYPTIMGGGPAPITQGGVYVDMPPVYQQNQYNQHNRKHSSRSSSSDGSRERHSGHHKNSKHGHRDTNQPEFF